MWQEEIQIERLRKGQANIRVRRETRQRKTAFITRFNPAKNAPSVAGESTTNPSYLPSRSKVPACGCEALAMAPIDPKTA